MSTNQTGHGHYPANKRYYCPACGQKAIQSVALGPHDYICPTNKTIVTAREVAEAVEISED